MADINQVQLPDGSQYNIKDTTSGYATTAYVQDQISAITKATIGLGNVDNTSDMNKPVSTAQQTAIDAKANNSTIAYTESSATATKRYEIGEQFILNGTLYTATAIIPNGGAITVGTNCSASDTIVEQIPNIDGKVDKTDLTSISESGTTASQAISAQTYFYLNGTLVRARTAIASGATFTLNTNYEAIPNGALNEPEIIYYKDMTASFTNGSKGGYYYFFSMPNNYQATSFIVDYNTVNASTATSGIAFYLGCQGLGTASGFIFCNQAVSNIGIRVFYSPKTKSIAL